MNVNTDLDSSIPVLTEVISETEGYVITHHSEDGIEKAYKGSRFDSRSGSAHKHDKSTTELTLDSAVKFATTSQDEGKKKAPRQAEPTKPAEPALSYEHLEKVLYDKVLRQVATRIDFVLEHQVKGCLAQVLDEKVDELTKDIRASLKLSLKELINKAVNQELSKIQSSKTKPH